jgi:hypothetical protein
MRSYNENYANVVDSSSKEPRWAVEISMGAPGEDLLYLTSHDDIETPAGEAVVHGVLQDIKGRSQEIDLWQLNSSIGNMSFSAVNLAGAVEAELRGKRAAGNHLYGKQVKFYHGDNSIEWDDYIVEATQNVSKKFDYRKGKYLINCLDPQSLLDRIVFSPKETRLSQTVTDSATVFPVYSTEGFELIQQNGDFTEAPSELCAFFEISQNKDKEFIKVTAIATGQFTVERGAFGSTAREWVIPANAGEDKGPKIREMPAVEMNMASFAWAFLTGEDIDNPGTVLFPSHWHCHVPTDLLNINEFLTIRDLNPAVAQHMALPKTNGKQFFEEQIQIPLGYYLKVNGEGGMNLKAMLAIHNTSNVVGTITADDMHGTGNLVHDANNVVNLLKVKWSWDERPTKPNFRRETNFKIENSYNEFGERAKPIFLDLINGSSSTSSTLLSIANRYMERYAGDSALFDCDVFHKLARYEVGDVLQVEHHAVADFTNVGSLGRPMQILGKTLDQKKGIHLKLFGSTFVGDPITDGDLRVMNDSFYPGEGTPIPNVSAGTLTADVTLNGTANINDAASIFYVDGDFIFPAARTINITGNVQLRIRGHWDRQGTINCAEGGAVDVLEGWVGDSVGGNADDVTVFETNIVNTSKIRYGEVLISQHDLFPTLDIVNTNGDSISGIPNDLRGCAGAQGASAHRTVWTNGEPNLDILNGAARVKGGAGLMVVCRSCSGNGQIIMDGERNNPQTTKTSSVETGSVQMYGGYSGDGAPGSILFLIDGGGIASIPNISGYISAVGDKENDLGIAVARIQVIPQARVVLEDEPETEPDQQELQYSVDGVANWHFPPVDGDAYFRAREGGGDWSDAFLMLPEDGLDGLPGAAGIDALGGLPIGFSPGVLGGAGDFVFTLDQRSAGVVNVGEIRVQGSRFLHPDGTQRTVNADQDVITNYGEGIEGRFYLMWSDEDRATRFALGSWGTSSNIVPIRVNSTGDGWEAFDNSAGTTYNITPLATDCVIAAVEAQTTTSGLTGIVPFVSGAVGQDGAPGDIGPEGPAGGDGSDGNNAVRIFQYTNADPATPTGNNPVGWYNTPFTAIANGVGPRMYICTGTKTSGGVLVGTWDQPEWSSGFNWGDLDGRPNELTDGRVGFGLDANGDLLRDLPLAIADGSNLLRFTNGGLFTGDLAATFGATWGADLTGQPLDSELFNNQITIGSNGSLLGAGGGQVTISGLGFSGDLNATFGSTWGVDVSGQPQDNDLLNSFVFRNRLLRNNLLDIEEWVEGESTWSGTEFAPHSTSSTTATNEIVQVDGPRGARALAWKSTVIVDQSGTGSWCGGFSYTLDDVDDRFHHSRSYRFSCWVRLSDIDDPFYMGYGSADVAVLGTGDTAQSNPYSFSNNRPPQANKWYLLVAVIHGSSYLGTTASGMTGYYDPVSGLRVKTGTEFKNLTANTSLFFRISQYRHALNNTVEYAFPRVDELDGNEPSIVDLLGTATVGATWGTDLTGQPTDSELFNSFLSIGSNGLLSGGGGGQVTITGLGYNGHLNATQGATWGTDLSGRPIELTDGRVASGLSALGDVNRNVPNSRITLGSVTQHEININALNLNNGPAEAGATLGATWGTDVSGRPSELTDGRIAATINGAAQLVNGVTVQQGNASNTYRNATMGLEAQQGRDGDVVTFTDAWDDIPVVKFSAGGLSQANALANDQFQDIKAINVSTSGFEISAELKELAGSTVARTDTGAVSTGTQDWEIHKSQSSQAFDDSYTFQYDVFINNQFNSEVGYLPGQVQVGLYTNDGTGWVKRATLTHNGGFGVANTTRANQTSTIVVDGLTNHGGREFGINIESDTAGGSTLNFDNVTYTTATDPASATATPSGAPDIQYFVLGGN